MPACHAGAPFAIRNWPDSAGFASAFTSFLRSLVDLRYINPPCWISCFFRLVILNRLLRTAGVGDLGSSAGKRTTGCSNMVVALVIPTMTFDRSLLLRTRPVRVIGCHWLFGGVSDLFARDLCLRSLWSSPSKPPTGTSAITMMDKRDDAPRLLVRHFFRDTPLLPVRDNQQRMTLIAASIMKTIPGRRCSTTRRGQQQDNVGRWFYSYCC